MTQATPQDRRPSLCCSDRDRVTATQTKGGRWYIQCSCCGGRGGGFKTADAAWSSYITRCGLAKPKVPHLRLVK